MKKSLIAICVCLSSVAFAGQHEIPGMSVSTADFNPDHQKVSQDGRCTLKRSDWTGEAWYSLYVYDKRDNNFQGALAIRNIEGGIELIAGEDINENCSVKFKNNNGKRNVVEKCDRFGAHEVVSLSVDEEGLIREISFSERKAGIGGHVPFPYAYSKKLNCKF